MISDRKRKGATVLLVDDNVTWAEYIRDELTAQSDELSIRLAGDAAEAKSLLTSPKTSFDCIVCDYQMPEVTGLDLLSSIRSEEDNARVPFILVTGQGSEDVASEAISLGVTDYIRKQQVQDQPSLLRARIERAVETEQLRQEVREQKAQYKTLLEHTEEGIFITIDGIITYVNTQLTEITGYSETELLDSDPVERLTSNGTWESVQDTRGMDDADTNMVRIHTKEGHTKVCDVETNDITFEQQDAKFWSVYDLTETYERRKQLRQERDFNQAVREILVQSTSGDRIEKAFCGEVIGEDTFELAWVGRRKRAGQIKIVAQAGSATEYLRSIQAGNSLDANDTTAPYSWVLRDGTPQFIEDISSMPESAWTDEAAEQGFEALAALPLVYEGFNYGVFCVYTTDTDTLDEDMKKLLEQLAEALAYAISRHEKENALTSSELATLTFSVTGEQYYLNAAARDIDMEQVCDRLEVTEVVPQSGGNYVEFATVHDGDAADLVERMRHHEMVSSVSLASEHAQSRIRIETEATPVGAAVKELGAKFEHQEVHHGVSEVTVHVARDRDHRAMVDNLSETFDINSVSTRTESQAEARQQATFQIDQMDLTEKQLRAIKTAYECDYFERPRGKSATEVAEILGVSHSTFLQHLRAGQAKIFAHMLEDEKPLAEIV